MKNDHTKLIASNKKAYHEYFIEETYEAGLQLFGTEVKSLRMGHCSLKESFIKIDSRNEIWSFQMHISPYEKGNIFNRDPLRPKKLLMHKNEIMRLRAKTEQKGYAIVPLEVYFKEGKAKVKIALARGKKLYDKREAIAKKDAKRDADRAFKGVLLKMAVISIILLFSSSPVFAAENDDASGAQRKTVRVGYFIGEGFQEISEVDGHRSGYCYEYLQTLSYYTGWQYEYVETTWAGALDKIAKGEIDILAQVSKTKDREEFMFYADRPMGNEDYYLYVLPNEERKLRSEDVSTVNGAIVGVNAGSYQLMTFIDWCKENGVECEIIESEDEDLRLNSFYKGELDAIVDNDFYLDQGWIPVFKTGSSDYYLCVTKSRPDLLDELNAAQEKLFENSPLFISKLQATYFPHDAVPKALNHNETEWIENRLKNHKTVKLGYLDNYLPYCDQNETTKQPEGVITLFIDKLKEEFGVEVESIPFESPDDLYKSVCNNEIDACFPLYDLLWQSEALGIVKTDAFIEFPVAYIFRKNEYGESLDGKSFAVARSSQMQFPYVLDKHPGAEFVLYDNYKECMDAIQKGKVDGMYINSFVLSRYFGLYQEYSDLDIVYVGENASLSLGVSIASCPELLTIFNKNITLIDDSVKTSYLVRNTQAEQKYLITGFLRRNALAVVVAILAVNAFIITIFIIQFRRVRLARWSEREALEIANDALEVATRANNSKTEFLSNMSHDMRTPMNAIVGMTAIATANIDDTEKVRHCLSEITVSSKHLLGLINDVLDMSKIEAGKLTLTKTKFNLVKMIGDFVTIVEPLAEEREHEFEVDISGIEHETVVGDAERIQQCLVNFTSNSVKYTPNGGSIKLTVTEEKTDRPDTGCYKFTVEDNGIGMSEEFVEIMFDPFTRAEHKHVTGQQGTGLGMSIARNIIKLMDGDIEVYSKLGEGTKVTITVLMEVRESDKTSPVSTSGSKIDNLQQYREEDFGDITILLVEDNEINAEIAVEILKMTGMNVDHVWSGKEAIEKISSVDDDHYGLVFMDIQMSGMDGYEATRIIRSSEREYLKRVPIIAMSANAFAEDIAKSKSIGMNDYISKPLNLDKLMDVLKKYIGR